MARDDSRRQVKYQSIVREGVIQTKANQNTIRADASGPWNLLKAWYLFLVHLMACILLCVMITQRINNHQFKTGSPPALFTSELYQTQVTGLVSLALVLIRLLAGCCSAFLAWNIIFIQLEKGGITLSEMTRLGTYRVPMVPWGRPKSQLLWSCWFVGAIVLSWPQSFAAPLANSSIAWIPSSRLSRTPTSVSIGTVGQFADWASLLYEDMRTMAVVNAASMAGKDPSYAFNSTELPLRRYFPLAEKIPANSTMSLTFPYIDVSLRWIDAASDNRSQHVGDPKYADLANLDFSIRLNGSISVIRNDTWDAERATPQAASKVLGTRLIAVKVNTVGTNDKLPNGSAREQDSPCPTTSPVFGTLPNVGQQTTSYFGGNIWAANDCFLLAEASVTAGAVKSTNCTVSPAGAIDHMATCSITPDSGAVEDDWLAGLGLDFISETMKYVVMLNLTQPWMQDNLEDYTIGMLTLGYHASWSSLMERLGNQTEPTTVREAESVVRATVNRTRIYVWLGMSIMLTISASLVAVATNFSATKTVRDTTLAALVMDLTEVTHSRCASGLCNAVALSKEDNQLPRMRMESKDDREEGSMCCRRVVFAHNDVSVNGRPHQ